MNVREGLNVAVNRRTLALLLAICVASGVGLANVVGTHHRVEPVWLPADEEFVVDGLVGNEYYGREYQNQVIRHGWPIPYCVRAAYDPGRMNLGVPTEPPQPAGIWPWSTVGVVLTYSATPLGVNTIVGVFLVFCTYKGSQRAFRLRAMFVLVLLVAGELAFSRPSNAWEIASVMSISIGLFFGVIVVWPNTAIGVQSARWKRRQGL